METTEFSLSTHRIKYKLFVLIGIGVTFIPALVFMYIIYQNPAFIQYRTHQDELIDTFGGWVTPSVGFVYNPAWIGIGFLVVASIIDVIFMFICKNKKIQNKNKIWIWFIAIIFFVLSAISFSVAEYNYGKVQVLFEYIKIMPNDELKVSLPFIDAVNNSTYKWASDTASWWILFVRLIFIVIGFIVIQNQLVIEGRYAEEVSKIIEHEAKRKRVGNNKFIRLLNKMFISSEKGISLWFVIVTIIILLPQFIYVVNLSTSSNISSMYKWSFVSSSLLIENDINKSFIDTMSEINNNTFLYVNMPIIMVGFSMATSIIFVAIYIRGWKVNSKVFTIQIIVQAVEVLATIAVCAVSMNETNILVNFWNSNSVLDKIHLENKDFDSLKNLLGMNFAQDIVPYLWLYGSEYISEVVISISFAITTYTMLANKLYIINKKRKNEKDKLENESEMVTVDIK